MTTEVTSPTTVATFTNPNAPASSAPQYAAAQDNLYIGSGFETFDRTPPPADLAAKEPTGAWLRIHANAGTGDRTMRVQQHGELATNYSKLTHNNRPAVLAGSTLHEITQDSADTLWEFDVLDDVLAFRAGAPFHGWRITSTHTKWGLRGPKSTLRPVLVVEYADTTQTPTGLRPDGLTADPAPVLTWATPAGMVSARAQIATAPADPDDPADFTTPLFDTGTEPTAVAQLDLDALGWAGMTTPGQRVVARVMHTTTAGDSDWSDPVTIELVAAEPLVLTSPGGSSTDPSPRAVWTMTGQAKWQAIYRIGTRVHDTGIVPGGDLSFTPPIGATADGQIIEIEVRGWPAEERTPTPRDPGYSSDTVTTTYGAGAGTAVVGLYAAQDGRKPWADLGWTRPAGIPDEWIIERDGAIIDRIPATDEDGSVLTYRDWRCPPNTNVSYIVRPVEDGVAGAAPAAPAAIRLQVTGAWLFEPVADGPYFWVKAGDDLAPAYSESSVWYVPTGGDHEVKRTFALRGISTDVAGRLDEGGPDGRPQAQQMADVWAIKSRPAMQLRCAFGSRNIPVIASDIDPQIHNALSSYERIIEAVRYHVKQNGENPFTAVVP